MKDATLREVCEKCDVSRRAVQGYEKEGLVMATGKNKMGHLLYDEEAQRRIRQIRVLQNLGFSIKEIKEIIDEPRERFAAIVEEQVVKLKEEMVHMEEQIRIAMELLEQEN